MQEQKDNPSFVILDVRTPVEFVDGHIENAVNTDFLSSDFREEANKLDKDKTYLIHCRSGRRSSQALAVMNELGFIEVYDMGGIVEWGKKGYPTTK